MSNFPAWTDERTAILTRMWLEGASGGKIAAALGEGVTRNAVIGKVHRLGLSGRTNINQPPKAVKPPRKRVRKPDTAFRWGSPASFKSTPPKPVEPEVFAMPDDSFRVHLLELPNDACHFPLDERDDEGRTFYCAAPGIVSPSRPYCRFHFARMYRPAQAPARKAGLVPTFAEAAE